MNSKHHNDTELQMNKATKLLSRFRPSRSQFISGAMMFTAGILAFAAAPTLFTSGTTISSSAMNANFSDIDARITALETVPAFQEPTLLNNWNNVGGQWATAGYTKDPMGFVHLRGLVYRWIGTGTIIFNLPDGYRPAAVLQFPVRCGDDAMCYVHIMPNGDVEFGGAGSPSNSLTLDGIIFDLR